jgi:hypothetical protein
VSKSWNKNLKKYTYPNEYGARKPLVVSILQKGWAETLQPSLEVDNFQPRLKTPVTSNASPAGRKVRF